MTAFSEIFQNIRDQMEHLRGSDRQSKSNIECRGFVQHICNRFRYYIDQVHMLPAHRSGPLLHSDLFHKM